MVVSCCVAWATVESACGVLRGPVRDGRSWICVVALVAADAVPEILPALARYFTDLGAAPPEPPWAFVTEAEAGLRAL